MALGIAMLVTQWLSSPFWSWLKYLNNYWMDLHGVLYEHSWFPENLLLVHGFEWDVFISSRWIAMKVGSDIDVSLWTAVTLVTTWFFIQNQIIRSENLSNILVYDHCYLFHFYEYLSTVTLDIMFISRIVYHYDKLIHIQQMKVWPSLLGYKP